ncbi:uncharacterized protein PADG_03838 [Paracoccidioides brasiliensis Pb18]|uniref:Hepatocellular carcinoma-associated antigen 59-domain-containing protein n=2 Tax=Paracoccidioides brasiliensis TaxID=121759 RepID=C1G9A2_PARBD|nr:uncharacterized protein PADG_03838 [Paracoccidioides brasiliensis Pb18]EEH47754.2 hypothetical protein PADG_03838 [Paracoccidioides brasiliensis Pb18]ODH39448.1 hypothetical protein ACO22_01905 [Paracoccidioides brasiliensis]ODH47447.1 hypothetical protein GX48_06483 [Paracoccidioides brasiliensis]
MSTMEIEEPRFRPVKRRKFLRKRHEASPDAPQPPQQSPDPEVVSYSLPAGQDSAGPETHPNEPQETDIGITDIFRRRKALKTRRGGVEFTPASKPAADDHGESLQEADSATQDPEDTVIRRISDRFVAHTGQKVDMDKHMMAYIESEMAKRHQIYNYNANASGSNEQTSESTAQSGLIRPMSDLQLPQRQPASLGKLHEIDLGPDAKLRNIERTEAATRRLAGDEVPDEDEEEKNAGSKKTRPGVKDAKNWRGRKRRNSEDIRRDKLVEEVLRESKLDVYDEPEVVTEQNDDQAADDRIAEKFRRDFLDAIHSRRRGARPKTSKTTKPDILRGPKLGGSRSARAMMREKAAAQKQ